MVLRSLNGSPNFKFACSLTHRPCQTCTRHLRNGGSGVAGFSSLEAHPEFPSDAASSTRFASQLQYVVSSKFPICISGLCLIRTSPPISFGRRVVCLAMRVDGSDICQDDWSWAATAHWTWQGSQNEGWMPSRSNDAAMARQWALYLRPDFRPSNALRT